MWKTFSNLFQCKQTLPMPSKNLLISQLYSACFAASKIHTMQKNVKRMKLANFAKI